MGMQQVGIFRCPWYKRKHGSHHDDVVIHQEVLGIIHSKIITPEELAAALISFKVAHTETMQVWNS
jgi:hypothetical protein